MIKLDLPGCGSVVSCFILCYSCKCTLFFPWWFPTFVAIIIAKCYALVFISLCRRPPLRKCRFPPLFSHLSQQALPASFTPGSPTPLLRGFQPIPGFSPFPEFPAHPSLGLPPSPGFPSISGFTPIPGVTPFPRFLVHLRPVISLNLTVSELFFGFFSDYLLSRIENLPGVVDELILTFTSYQKDHKGGICFNFLLNVYVRHIF